MALLPIHEFFILNNEIQPCRNFIPSENEGGIYEVLRVVEEIPLFLEDHLARFFKSAQIAGKKIPFSVQQIEGLLFNLIQANQVENGNVLISCKENLKAFFIPHSYPTPEMYKNGVACGVLKAERENPNAKVFQTSVRQQANTLIQEKGFYEVVLVDKNGKITEGSKSNLFFVKGDSVVTSPGAKVLLGITRQQTIKLLKNAFVPFLEEEIFFDDLCKYQAAFITGTSPNVLPIASVAQVAFDVNNNLVRKTMGLFYDLVFSYIKQQKSCDS